MEENKDTMKIEYVSIDTIKPNQYNPKKMTQKEARKHHLKTGHTIDMELVYTQTYKKGGEKE